MIFLEGLLFVAIFYLVAGLSTYAYAIVMNKTYVGYYLWRMSAEYVGICKYPYWMMFWIYKLQKIMKLDTGQ